MLTVYGIETLIQLVVLVVSCVMLQQCLPFTVLKQPQAIYSYKFFLAVATVLTVYGIETFTKYIGSSTTFCVATVLTVYGIETCGELNSHSEQSKWLQQCLPFTVLKPIIALALDVNTR